MAYELEFPSSLGSINLFFHVYILRKCVGDPFLVVTLNGVGVSDSLSYEQVTIEILDR